MTSQLPNGLGSGSVIAVDFSALGDPQSWQLWRSVLRAAFGLELDADVRLRSIRLSQSLVPKVAVAGTLHDGLRARELYVGTKSLGHREVRTADQQESELRLTKLLVELSVSASRNVEL